MSFVDTRFPLFLQGAGGQTKRSAGSPSAIGRAALTASVVSSMDAFMALEAEWHTLYEALPEKNLNIHHAWLATWLANFPPAQLMVITVRDAAGALVGVAPFKIDRTRFGLAQRLLRQVQFIGTEPDIYESMRILVHPQAYDVAVTTAVAEILRRHQAQWDMLNLRFCSEPAQLTTLLTVLDGAPHPERIQKTSAIPYARLSNAIDDQTQMKKKLKRKFQALKKDFPDRELVTRNVPSGEEADRLIGRMVENHIEYWAKRGYPSDFKRFPHLHAFYRDIHHRFAPGNSPDGEFHFTVIQLDDEPIVFDFSLWHTDSAIYHITSYNESFHKYSPGMLLLLTLYQRGMEEGVKRFEFGRGDEPYKYKYAEHDIPLYTLLHFQNPLAPIIWQTDEGLRTAKHAVRGLLKRTPAEA